MVPPLRQGSLLSKKSPSMFDSSMEKYYEEQLVKPNCYLSGIFQQHHERKQAIIQEGAQDEREF